jgi:uncharacterized cupredoxin-like copper-binding protein
VSSISAQRPLRLAVVAAAALAVVIAGCGESRKQASSTATNASSPPAAQTAKAARADFAVAEREFSLTPSNLQVARTGTFTLTVSNAGSVTHALEVQGPAGEVKSGPIAPGQAMQVKLALTKPGRYQWYCPIDGHRGRGMRGTVVVGGKSKPKSQGGGSGSSGGGTPGDYSNYP